MCNVAYVGMSQYVMMSSKVVEEPVRNLLETPDNPKFMTIFINS